MSSAEYQSAKRDKDLPDWYVRSAELEVELDESRYRDLTDPPTDLSDEEKREVEQELKRDSISVPLNND